MPNDKIIKNKKGNLQPRPPVVVILGHVDHGKSSLLEKIKDLKITEKESGGITQHIAAYQIEEKGKKITFIDTPGHQAFSAMRSRGAQVADIAVLVVAAEEGVKPQTKEAISHIKKAGIPLIVALNKMDKPGADPEKVKRELLRQEISVESMGGKIPSVQTSAQTGQGISELLDLILLLAEMEGLKADFSAPGRGIVVESYLDPRRGLTATLILRNGVLKKNDILATASAFGKVKILEDFQGKKIDKALPSMPALVLGFEKAPAIGEEFQVFSSPEEAKKQIAKKELGSLGTEFLKAGPEQKFLNLILKVDVSGSGEAIGELLKEIPQEKIALRILKAEPGPVNESDVKLAQGAKAVIIGFRVKAGPAAQKLAERERIKIIFFEVIYELAQAVKNLLEKRVKPEKTRSDLGKVKVLEIFLREKNRQIIGAKVVEGQVKRGAFFDAFRAEEKIGSGKIVELQRDKKKVGSLDKGSECGILYQGEMKIEKGDLLSVFEFSTS